MGMEFDPTKRIEDFILTVQGYADRADDLSPVFNDVIIPKIMQRERRMFETRGATSGVYWSPLKKATVERKKRDTSIHDPFAPLRETDSLMKSLSERDARYQILEVDADGFTFGTSHPAAGFHMSGTTHMAKRPPLIIPKSHAQEYIGDINEFIFRQESD